MLVIMFVMMLVIKGAMLIMMLFLKGIALATMLVLRLRSCLLWNCLLGLWGLRIGSFDDLIEFTTVEPYSTTIRAVINLHSLAICHLKFSSNTYRAFHTHVLL